MSNKRIDLTPFEGIKEWEVERRLDGGYAIKTGRDNFSLDEAETIAKLPTLIDELKRCYETIDYLALHMHVFKNTCPMCYTEIVDNTPTCQHIIWNADGNAYTTTFEVHNDDTGRVEQHVFPEKNSLLEE
jgi:hypothetical protein